MRSVAKRNHLKIPREATRSKDPAINWICENWNIAEAQLSEEPVLSLGDARQANEVNFSEYWEKMCEIDNLLATESGHKMPLPNLAERARDMARKFQIQLPREIMRNRRTLLAWCAMNWPQIQPGIEASLLPKEDKPLVADAPVTAPEDGADLACPHTSESFMTARDFEFLSDVEKVFGFYKRP
jgi:hypothetical protein